jgi:hypothetical protein
MGSSVLHLVTGSKDDAADEDVSVLLRVLAPELRGNAKAAKELLGKSQLLTCIPFVQSIPSSMD